MSKGAPVGCRLEAGTITFESVHATLDLSATSTLFRQAAELGISHEAALRSLIASAARRAQLVEIPAPLPSSLGSTMLMPLPPLRVSPLMPCIQSSAVLLNGAMEQR